ncbi:hypothetical protein C8J57DRAFT_1235779 [Mycena rebaudengoi]|nr:hypothetical protein C8J57DRAFT_1235779 [Mycena rebaudengoi]
MYKNSNEPLKKPHPCANNIGIIDQNSATIEVLFRRDFQIWDLGNDGLRKGSEALRRCFHDTHHCASMVAELKSSMRIGVGCWGASCGMDTTRWPAVVVISSLLLSRLITAEKRSRCTTKNWSLEPSWFPAREKSRMVSEGKGRKVAELGRSIDALDPTVPEWAHKGAQPLGITRHCNAYANPMSGVHWELALRHTKKKVAQGRGVASRHSWKA